MSGTLRQVFRGRQLRSSIGVMIVVGTLLNLINQGDAMFGPAAIHWPKLLLTYLVPFAVASFGAWSALRSQRSGPGRDETRPSESLSAEPPD